MQAFPPLPGWVELEHEVAKILTEQELHGWYFDERSARELESTLRQELRDITEVLQNRYPFVKGNEFTPRRNNKTQGYVEGAPFTRLKQFNPSSRDHIAWILSTFDNFDPSGTTTNTGKPKIDETVLKNHGTGLATQFLRILEITKSLGMISEGANAWLKLCTSANRIHHHCSVATATGRCAHRNPNLGQCPADPEYRRLFIPSPGKVMVGADLAGVELRMLSHYLARYDAGRYADILVNGDIHQVNADKIGISRRQVKTVTYAFLYGAGDQKIGHSFDDTLSEAAAKKKGAEIRDAYISAIDGLGSLLAAVKHAANRSYIRAIDGRKIPVDSEHKALNYLLQGSSAVLAKRWMLINQQNILEHNINCSQLAFVHDELQFECHQNYAKQLSESLESSATRAGEYYNLRVPIAADSKTGRDWSEVH